MICGDDFLTSAPDGGWRASSLSLSVPLSLSLCASSTLVAESGGDTAKLSEGSGLKVDRQFIRRGEERGGGWNRKEDCEEEEEGVWLDFVTVGSFFVSVFCLV